MSNLNLKPTPGYLLIKPEEAESKTASGIFLPDSAGEKPQIGEVLAVGDEEITDSGTKRPAPASVGDKVVYKKWGGNEIKINQTEYMFVKFDDILAVYINK